MNLFNIRGKNILITGASSGIGREIAIQCSEAGANVVITGRDIERLKETSSYINTLLTLIPCDLSNVDNILEFVPQLPKLDGVIFCAGIAEYLPVKFINKDKMQNIFSVNFDSQVILTQQLIKHKKLNNNSSLVYVSSIASKLGVAGTAMYASSKAALNAFMKVTASELAIQKIRANSICPGIVITPMGEKAQNMSTDALKDYPLGLGQPINIVGPCIFFLSDASKWITGTELIIDGGLTLK
jgi:NAD(P)-dependent dehydrogenase (short-subunit alcohol dehydrogenase family)